MDRKKQLSGWEIVGNVVSFIVGGAGALLVGVFLFVFWAYVLGDNHPMLARKSPQAKEQAKAEEARKRLKAHLEEQYPNNTPEEREAIHAEDIAKEEAGKAARAKWLQDQRTAAARAALKRAQAAKAAK